MTASPSAAPSVRDVLLKLADRCEKEEPLRELDIAIHAAISGLQDRGDASEVTRANGEYTYTDQEGRRRWTAAPRYTTSLDAAVTLMGERDWGLVWDVESVHASGVGLPNNIGVCAYVWLDHKTNEDVFVRSPPVKTFAEAVKWLPRLICTAALRARSSLTGGQ